MRAAARVRRRQRYRPAQPLPGRDPAELIDEDSRPAPGGRLSRATSRASAAAATVAGADAVAARAGGGEARRFRLGDDVVHAAFGEGVVTGVEPGGIVVVRFARTAPSAS